VFAGANYSVSLWRANEPPVRLGQGKRGDLSADGKWALAGVPSVPPRLMMYPTGAGEPIDTSLDGFLAYTVAPFLPGDKGVFFCGAEEKKGPRGYVRKLPDGPIRAVTPEGMEEGRASYDGQSVVARRIGGRWFQFPMNGGEGTPVRGLAPRDDVIRWHPDGTSLLIFRHLDVPSRVERFELATGERTVLRELVPSDLAGVTDFWGITVSPDASADAYSFGRTLNVLFSVDGVR
jgi:hypothetical protein